MTERRLKIRLDRTLCDGFGICAKHAPEYFSLDDWGYASLIGDGTVPEKDRDAVMRALMDCPVHAIIEMGEHRPSDDGRRRPDARRGPEPRPRKPKTTKRCGDSSGDRRPLPLNHRRTTSSSGPRAPTARCASRSAATAKR